MTLTSESFSFVADLVRRRSAISLAPGKEYLVESRLLPLARRTGKSVDQYIADLRRRWALSCLFARIRSAPL